MTRIAFKGIADAKPPRIVPEGKHDMRIIAAKHGISRTTKRGRLEVLTKAEDDPECSIIRTYFGDPMELDTYLEAHAEDEQSKTKEDWAFGENRKALSLKSFMVLFDVPIDLETEEFDTDDFAGQTATVVVTHKEGLNGGTDAQLRVPDVHA